ncbi:ATP synthase subunit delta, partial [Striga asiatica]
SWWKVRWLLQKGLLVEVRNGASVRVQYHNWVLRIIKRNLQLKSLDNSPTIWVKDLLDESRGQWDEQKVEELFEEEDCVSILQIRSLNPLVEDKWSWSMDKTKMFTIASSYAFLSQRKSWWKVRWLLQKGLLVEVRNGASVRVQYHNWVPGIIKRNLQLKSLDNSPTIWVKDLLDESRSQWDEQKVKELFEEEDCVSILQIQSLNHLVEDKWSWSMNKTKKFTITSSYAFLSHFRNLETCGCLKKFGDRSSVL